jgi:hypothetical protein
MASRGNARDKLPMPSWFKAGMSSNAMNDGLVEEFKKAGREEPAARQMASDLSDRYTNSDNVNRGDEIVQLISIFGAEAVHLFVMGIAYGHAAPGQPKKREIVAPSSLGCYLPILRLYSKYISIVSDAASPYKRLSCPVTASYPDGFVSVPAWVSAVQGKRALNYDDINRFFGALFREKLLGSAASSSRVKTACAAVICLINGVCVALNLECVQDGLIGSDPRLNATKTLCAMVVADDRNKLRRTDKDGLPVVDLHANIDNVWNLEKMAIKKQRALMSMGCGFSRELDYLITRFFLLATRACGSRFHVVGALALRDIFLREARNVGPRGSTAPTVLNFASRNGKLNAHNRLDYYGMLQHRNPLFSVAGALGEWFVFFFKHFGRTFPNFLNKEEFLNIMIMQPERAPRSDSSDLLPGPSSGSRTAKFSNCMARTNTAVEAPKNSHVRQVLSHEGRHAFHSNIQDARLRDEERDKALKARNQKNSAQLSYEKQVNFPAAVAAAGGDPDHMRSFDAPHFLDPLKVVHTDGNLINSKGGSHN